MKKHILSIFVLFALMGVMNIDARREDTTGLEHALFAKSPEEESVFESRIPRDEGWERGAPSHSGSAAQVIQPQPVQPSTQPVEKAGYSLTIIRKDTPIQGTSQEFQFKAEKQKLEGNVSDFKEYLSGSSNEYFHIPIEQQKLLFNGHELKNEDSLSKIPSGSILYLEVPEKKSDKKQEEKAIAQSQEQQVVSQPLPKKQSVVQPSVIKKQSLSKPINKMTSREIGALDVNNLSDEQKKELVKIALFSGLESNRSAARKVIEVGRGKKDWTQEVKELKDEILNEFKKSIGYQVPKGREGSAKLAKPIGKMTSREIGSLKYENLQPMEQEQLFEMALFSGLESNRSAARKVIDAYHKSQKMNPIGWDKQLTDIFAE